MRNKAFEIRGVDLWLIIWTVILWGIIMCMNWSFLHLKHAFFILHDLGESFVFHVLCEPQSYLHQFTMGFRYAWMSNDCLLLHEALKSIWCNYSVNSKMLTVFNSRKQNRCQFNSERYSI